MIVDTSVLIAILKREPELPRFARLLEEAPELHISAATYLEASIVIDGLRDPLLSRLLDELIERAHIQIEPVTAEQAQLARAAYRDFGRGSGHRANLNFGDCFSYALALSFRQPLLFKGDDFIHTGIPQPVQ